MTPSELIDQLELDLNDLLKRVRGGFFEQASANLLHRSAPDQWNALECFAHLNAQFDYYLPRIERALHQAKARKWMPADQCHSNWLGRHLIHRVDPTIQPIQPRKSRKALDPLKLLAVRENEVKVFLINLEMMLRLVRQARDVDTNRPRIKTMQWNISSFVLGDLLQYLVLHAQRHVLQADKAIAA